jgi:hypothetical protein
MDISCDEWLSRLNQYQKIPCDTVTVNLKVNYKVQIILNKEIYTMRFGSQNTLILVTADGSKKNVDQMQSDKNLTLSRHALLYYPLLSLQCPNP